MAEQERTIRAQKEEIRLKAKEYEEIKKVSVAHGMLIDWNSFLIEKYVLFRLIQLNDGYAKTLERREGLLKLLGVNPDDPAPARCG